MVVCLVRLINNGDMTCLPNHNNKLLMVIYLQEMNHFVAKQLALSMIVAVVNNSKPTVTHTSKQVIYPLVMSLRLNHL